MAFPIPDVALAQHIAVLGKTGSGKTSTAKLAVEHVVKKGARVCILDPIKSDWWGLTSSVNGEKAGLPFHILGGPRGHVSLHASAGKAVGEIVASGELPLSIIDMANFNPGGQAQFFVDFAPTLIRKMRGVVYLVIEEAHLFAPKERSGIGAENMSIHWAKMLATAGRSKGIRLILVTQRTQALHNALLGSCDTMIAHRLTAPADQEPVVKWLKANTDKATTEKVAGSLSSLSTGTAWLCSGEAKVFELVRFPRITTYDNTATPTGDGDNREIKTAPVDQDRLRAIIGTAVKEAEANDPKVLRAELAKANAELAKLRKSPIQTSQPVEKINTAALEATARAAGWTEGWATGWKVGHAKGCKDQAEEFDKVNLAATPDAPVPPRAPKAANVPQGTLSDVRPMISTPTGIYAKPMQAARATVPTDGLTTPQRRIMAAIGFWRSVGTDAPNRAQVAGVAGYSPGSGGFNNLLGALKTAGLIEIPTTGCVALADGAPFEPMNRTQAADRLWSVFSNPEAKLVNVALSHAQITRDALAKSTDYSAGSGGFNNLIGHLCTLTVFEKPSAGAVALSDWAREVLA